MRKTGCPWYRKANDSWYVWHGGHQVLLAKGRENKAEAHRKFAELIGAKPTGSTVVAWTVQTLIQAFEEHLTPRIKASTLASYRVVFQSFVDCLGKRSASDITATDLEAWASAQDWSRTTRRYALTVVGGSFRWAEQFGHLSVNPIRGLHKPPGRSRGTEVLIDDNLHQRLLSVASPQFRDFIETVRATGARPGEIARLEAHHVVWDAGCAVLREHKTDKTGRVRTIYLPPSTLALCRILAERYPVGPLFRNTRAETWKKTGWKQAMERAQRKLGLEKRPLTSGYRHTFATDALVAGVPDAQVAELLGHSGTAMLHKHHSHLTAQSQALRRALDQVRGGQ